MQPNARISLPDGFLFGEAILASPHAPAGPPSLGPLSSFVGTWSGKGFNTIFRSDSQQTPTQLPTAVNGSDNVLELNLTSESLSFLRA